MLNNSTEDSLFSYVSSRRDDAWTDKIGVEFPSSFSSLSPRILRGTKEIKSSSHLITIKVEPVFEPLCSAKHMIIQRQIALIIGTISGFEHPLQGHTMLVEII